MNRLDWILGWGLPLAVGLPLGGLSVAAWVRTRGLRRGHLSVALRGPRTRAPGPTAAVPPATDSAAARATNSGATSVATHLAWVEGLAVAAAGAAGAVGGRPWGIPLLGAGAFVTAAGAVGRVTGIGVTRGEVRVHRAGRAPFVFPWADLRSLRPLRAPPGAWRLCTARGSLTLMPSDLLGREGLLEALVLGADLRFGGRSWRRQDRGQPDARGRPPVGSEPSETPEAVAGPAPGATGERGSPGPHGSPTPARPARSPPRW